MSNKELVTKAFDAEIERIFSPKEDIKNFLLSHERKETCINNLLHEIRLIELSKAVKIDRDRILGLSADFARTFSKASLEYVERQNMTKLQKRIESTKAEEDAYFESLFEEEVTITDKSESL